MEVILAGFNIDKGLLDEVIDSLRDIKNFSNPDQMSKLDKDEIQSYIDNIFKISNDLVIRDSFTPETISAAYARISRNPLPVYELRKQALKEVDKARKSNDNIIFGLGHSSVAEHSVFNFDFIGLSRLAVEEIQKFRLCSFTEKSQRYIKIEKEYIVPDEVNRSEYLAEFLLLIEKQNELYLKLFEELKEYFERKYKGVYSGREYNQMVEGSAKEDARYALSLSTTSQMGATINARNLEYMISKLLSNELIEVRTFAEKLFQVVDGIAPSLIKYTKPREYYRSTLENIRLLTGHSIKKSGLKEEVRLLEFPRDGDLKLCASLLFSTSGNDYNTCMDRAREMNKNEKIELVKTALAELESYDSVIREFETIDLVFEMVVSASAFAQLKRHRMSTLISQDYDPELSLTVPESIIEIGMTNDLRSIFEQSTELYNKSYKDLKRASSYLLTNAHRRRVLFKINARQLYHFSRLREDIHAQWDIRNLSSIMSKLVKKEMPITFMLIGGKDRFRKIFENIFSK